MGLHYTDSGQGEKTLIFLHYFGGASGSWNGVIQHLQTDFRCIAIDLLGFGKSISQTNPISVDDSANLVLEFLQSTQLTNYSLIGHSMGGKIALNVTAQQPQGLQSLILIAPSPPTAEPMEEEERMAMNEAFGNKEALIKLINTATATLLEEKIFGKELEYNLAVSETGWHSWPQVGSKEDISGRMKKITVPISIICGECDKKFTKGYLQNEFSRYFSSFPITEIPKAGHLIPVEAPITLATTLRHICAQ